MSEPEELDLPGLVRSRAAEGRRKAAETRRRKAAEQAVAAESPVARVWLADALPHLDRDYEYLVPEALAAQARPGVRLKVPFAGRDVDAYLIERRAEPEYAGTLAKVRRVVSPEAVLTPAIAALADRLAADLVGTRADLLRLAVPPRHAATEKASPAGPGALPRAASAAPVETAAWSGTDHGVAFVEHVRDGDSPRAVWHAQPGADWAGALAGAVSAAQASGRGALVVLPTARDVALLDQALGATLDRAAFAVLRADAGPAERYRQFLRAIRGQARVVIGTRSAAFAPVRDLGLVALWDDGDASHEERRAPYPHVREVLARRAEIEGAAALIGGFAATVDAAQLLADGWARPIRPTRAAVRRTTITVAGAWDGALERDPYAYAARFPHEAHQLITASLARGPVLVQVARRPEDPVRDEPGSLSSVQELGRMFPGVRLVTSSGDRPVLRVEGRPALVVSSPGVEPTAAGGYAAVLVADTWLGLGLATTDAEEDFLRRWSNALGLLGDGGRGLIVGDPAHPLLQPLVAWNQPTHAERALAQRADAHLPPAWTLAVLGGTPGALDDAAHLLALPPEAETARGEDLVIRVPRSRRRELARALGEFARLRSSRRLDPVRVHLDPAQLG